MRGRDRCQLWMLLGLLLCRECTAHIRLTYPQARKYDFDFLDNIRTPAPCGGMPKDPGHSTKLQAGTKMKIEWHLSYPHRGGYYFQLMADNNTELGRYPASGMAGQADGTSLSYDINLPPQSCSNCTLRMVRQAGEWTAGSGQDYLFWSCADVDIVPQLTETEMCSGHGTYKNAKCECDRLFHGENCQFKDECVDDGDCGGPTKGQCVQTDSTSYPKSQCYCKPGWFGSTCQKVSPVAAPPVDLTGYQRVQLRQDITLHYKILQDTQEVEVVMSAKTVSWMSLGWRTRGTGASCRNFPNLSNIHSYATPEVEPVAESKPEPKAEGTAKPEGSAEPKAEVTAKPAGSGVAEPVAEVTGKPAGSGVAEPVAEVTSKPSKSGVAEPVAEVPAKSTGNSTAEPVAEVPAKSTGNSTAEPVAEIAAKPAGTSTTAPVAEVTAKPAVNATAEPLAWGKAEPIAEVTVKVPAAEPVAEVTAKSPAAEPVAEGTAKAPAAEPVAEGTAKAPAAEPVAEGTAEPARVVDCANEPSGAAEPKSEGEPSSEGTSEPKSQSEPKTESEPTSEGEPSNNGLHPMDCTDVVIAQAKGNLYRVGDFYTRDRSTPVMDEYLGGVNSLTAALAWEKDDTTTMIFRRKLTTSDPADHEFKNELMHVIWAVGQRQGAYRHSPCSALETSKVSISDYYKKDELKYHGVGALQRGTASVNFFSVNKPTPQSNCLRGSCPAGQCGLDASWEFDPTTDTVNFTLRANVNTNRNAWVAVGFSDDSLMANTDVIYGAITQDGTHHVWDGYLKGYSTPEVDKAQDVTDFSINYDNGFLTFTFKRKRDTGDKSDYNLATSCPRLFFGVGGDVVDALGTIRKHIAVPYVSPQQICFRPCGAVGNPDVSSMTEKNYKIQGELTLRNEVFVPALSDPKSPEFQKRAADVMSNVEHVLRPFFGDRLVGVTILQMKNGSIIVDFLLELKSASSLDEVVQKANATLREQLPYENFSLRLAEFSPVSANEMHQEGLSEVEIIVIALAVALVVVAIIIAVCKIVEVKKAKSGYKRGVIREYSMSSGNTATTTMTYREFIASGDADASYEGKKPPSSGSSAYVNHAYDASGYQKNAP